MLVFFASDGFHATHPNLRASATLYAGIFALSAAQRADFVVRYRYRHQELMLSSRGFVESYEAIAIVVAFIEDPWSETALEMNE